MSVRVGVTQPLLLFQLVLVAAFRSQAQPGGRLLLLSLGGICHGRLQLFARLATRAWASCGGLSSVSFSVRVMNEFRCRSFAKFRRSSPAGPDIFEIFQVDVRLVKETAVGLLHASIAETGIFGHLRLVRKVRFPGLVECSKRQVDLDTPFFGVLLLDL